MNIKILDSTAEYGGLDTVIKTIYVDLDNYKLYSLFVNLDSIQEQIFEKSLNDDNKFIINFTIRNHQKSKECKIGDIDKYTLSRILPEIRNLKIDTLIK